MEKDTQNIEKLMELVLKAMLIGKKVWSDKEVNFKDLEHADDLIALVKEVYEFISSKPELGAEFKDISIPEILALVAKGDSMVKQVEKV